MMPVHNSAAAFSNRKRERESGSCATPLYPIWMFAVYHYHFFFSLLLSAAMMHLFFLLFDLRKKEK